MIELYGRRMVDPVRRNHKKKHLEVFRDPTPVDNELVRRTTGDLLGWDGGPSGHISISERNGVIAAISGEPRWKSPELVKMAAQEGHGAALRIAYDEHGYNAIRRVFGRFAIIILDENNRRLALAVDRMGIERLCYCFDEQNSLTFGTSLTSVKRLRPTDSTISNQALFDFVYFDVIPSPGTIYEGVMKLEPGQMLTFDGLDTKLSYYWTPTFRADNETSEADLSAELLELLRIAVERCGANERTGCFLSGGLDSSTVTGLACNSNSTTVDAFTIGFDQPGYDEVTFARAAAKHFGASLKEYYVTAVDIADTIDKIATTYDEPFGNSSAIPTLFCARLAAEHGKTHLLAGDGGDELFAGNDRYDTQTIFDYYGRIPGWLKSVIIEPLFLSRAANWTHLSRKVRRYIEQANVEMPGRLQTYNTLNVNSIADVFTAEFLRTVDTAHPASEMEKWYHKDCDSDLLNHMLLFDWKLTLADNDIRKVSAMCDRENVRVSYPMLDDDLVDFSTTIPSDMKMRRGQLRRFYKNSLSDFLPREVLKKSKHGFGLPFGEWLRTSVELQSVINPILDSLASRGFIKPSFIETMRYKHTHEHASYYGGIIWTLVMLEQWIANNT